MKYINEFQKLPFKPEYLYNLGWHPSQMDLDAEYMGQENYDKAVKEFEDTENLVVFDDLMVVMETCDCGDGYGCSHADWPYEIKHNFGKEITLSWEDDGFYIETPKGYLRFDKTDEMTIGDFYYGCKLLGVELSINDNGLKLLRALI